MKLHLVLLLSSLVFMGGGHKEQGIKIMTTAFDHFPIGNAGQDGAHAAEPTPLYFQI